MPLIGTETFKVKLQRHSRIVVPKLVRWRHKIDPGEVLLVRVAVYGSENLQEEFLAKMAVDGRLTIPKLTLQILTEREERDLTGSLFEVTIYPGQS